MDVGLLTVFTGSRAIANGTREELVSVIRQLSAAGGPAVLVFDDLTGEQVDLDLRDQGSPAKPDRPGPGRPKLGVVAREVTLLPRHWEWLNAQPSGASATLRKLVEAARRSNAERDRVQRSQEAAFRFMTAIAGNEPGFEEAARALFASDRRMFEQRIAAWPSDVAAYTRRLSVEAFPQGV